MGRIRRPSGQTLAVLWALAEEAPAWVHGYELCRATGLKAGTVYPILIRLAERGQLDARWEADAPLGRPARHLYRLSADGAQYVADLRREAAKPSRTPKPQIAGA
ncbi:PadR family transcriptional regulator [Kribbella sp. NBC_00889]|uniref:PadR family transcriptional regulator n=1 Tax=Kribbella sp. NBC_00889 TaxID=2975974 RepID=UPI003865A348|nr:PadR family transcriptional regulator [Kribbella sp. NBC_00889]